MHHHQHQRPHGEQHHCPHLLESGYYTVVVTNFLVEVLFWCVRLHQQPCLQTLHSDQQKTLHMCAVDPHPSGFQSASSAGSQRKRRLLLDGKSSVPSSLERQHCEIQFASGREATPSSGCPAAGQWSGAAARGMSRSTCGGSFPGRDSRRVGKRLTHKDSVLPLH